MLIIGGQRVRLSLVTAALLHHLMQVHAICLVHLVLLIVGLLFIQVRQVVLLDGLNLSLEVKRTDALSVSKVGVNHKVEVGHLVWLVLGLVVY